MTSSKSFASEVRVWLDLSSCTTVTVAPGATRAGPVNLNSLIVLTTGLAASASGDSPSAGVSADLEEDARKDGNS
jgi:hypothetical protein